MPLMPKRVKYRKVQRGRIRGNASRNTTLSFGDYGLQTMDTGRITSQQIESARTAVTRHLKRHGKLWIKIFPDKPFTKKPLEVRMGKGKGNPEGWMAEVRPGNVILELSGCVEPMAREALARAANKLPVRCKFLSR
ncbi:MAG: 50S ribosomal protein L16 [Candidatus Pacebacteria bacterium]|nr:50S ribosomal protein L16 [Candidatus Paceibacterota bacterium]